jgi:hypothetical protein
VILLEGLSGNYTIGPMGDFADFTSAVDALQTFGVCGHVVIEAVLGTYTEQLSIGEIPDTNATNTVTFRSAAQSQDSVRIEFASFRIAANYTVQLNGADHVTWEDVNIASTGVIFGTVINIVGGLIITLPVGDILRVICHQIQQVPA